MRDSISHLHLGSILDTRDDVTYLTGGELVAWYHIHLQHAYLISIIFHASVEELHLITLADGTILYLEVSNDTTEGVEHGVEDQGLQWSLWVALRMGNTIDHSLQDIFYALTGLTRSTKDVLVLAADEIDNLVLYLFRHSRRHVYLVDNRNDFQVVLDSHVEVGDGLRLHTLGSIHDQERSLASCDGT